MSFEYNGMSYGSKSDAIRDMYDKGFVTMESNSKKQLAKALGITVSTVHATIVKYVGNSKKPDKDFKLQKSIEAKPISIKGMIAITQAPNQWGLPVCNPPIMINPKTEKKIKINDLQLF